MNLGYLKTLGYLHNLKKEIKDIKNQEINGLGDVVLKLWNDSNKDRDLFDKKMSYYTEIESRVIKEYLDNNIDLNGLYELVIPRRAYRLYKKYEVEE